MPIIATNPSSCKDCYRCVRACPVKAIRIQEGHAEVVAERCILDGECVRSCPQHAKVVTTDVDDIRHWLEQGQRVALSLAPSFVSAFALTPQAMITSCHQAGFAVVSETALAAPIVARKHRECLATTDAPLIASCCPTIVNLVELYYPDLVGFLAPVVSPMVAHAMMLKRQFGPEIKVVFAGPCLAKVRESKRPDLRPWVDGVITFQDLSLLIMDQSIGPPCLERSNNEQPIVSARLFPLAGGLLRTAEMDEWPREDTLSATGLLECMEILDQLKHQPPRPFLVELLACRGGCINGPGHTGLGGLLKRREDVRAFARQPKAGTLDLAGGEMDLSCRFVAQPQADVPNDDAIKAILASIGKNGPEDELNCGACGYNSCREKAVAVFHGMAEREMCMPYMRQQAESMANAIILSSPNAVVVVDQRLQIVEINPAFAALFACQKEKVRGHSIEQFMDSAPFAQAMGCDLPIHSDITVNAYGLIIRATLFYAAHQRVIVGLLTNVTQEVTQQRQLDRVRGETLEKAQEVINKQMRVAQEIAGLLGETTAETKVLLSKLMKVMRSEGGA